jgi:hypothetical protein
MVNLGKAIKLSSWDERVRIEHAMIHGFLKAPKMLELNLYTTGKLLLISPIFRCIK